MDECLPASESGVSRNTASKALQSLEGKKLLAWHGSGPRDPTQYYSEPLGTTYFAALHATALCSIVQYRAVASGSHATPKVDGSLSCGSLTVVRIGVSAVQGDGVGGC